MSHHVKRTGNKPPWTLPAKAAYSKFDSARACRYFGVPPIKTPDFFPILSIMVRLSLHDCLVCLRVERVEILTTAQPQRCMIYIKRHYPRERFETTFLSLWEWMYYQNIDISKAEHMARLLRSHGFAEQEVEAVLAAASSPEYKEALAGNTQKALGQGAYGAPWFWVRNREGKEEPFFGSDRLVSSSFVYLWC